MPREEEGSRSRLKFAWILGGLLASLSPAITWFVDSSWKIPLVVLACIGVLLLLASGIVLMRHPINRG